MHRPLRVPLLLRVWNLLKGLLFYNTWNWEKASDGLNLPKLSREEREQKRPKPDPEIIKPREKPRARLDLRRRASFSEGSYQTQVSDPLPVDYIEQPKTEESELTPPAESAGPEMEYIKRRKYKKRRTSSATGGNSFFRRVFGRE